MTVGNILKQELNEEVNGELYHLTNAVALKNILKHNRIRYSFQKFPSDLEDVKFKGNNGFYISLTRQPEKAKDFGEYIIVFDRTKLLREGRIKPFVWKKLTKELKVQGRNSKFGGEAEERILATSKEVINHKDKEVFLSPLSKYIKSIFITGNKPEFEDLKEYSKSFNIPVLHIKKANKKNMAFPNDIKYDTPTKFVKKDKRTKNGLIIKVSTEVPMEESPIAKRERIKNKIKSARENKEKINKMNKENDEKTSFFHTPAGKKIINLRIERSKNSTDKKTKLDINRIHQIIKNNKVEIELEDRVYTAEEILDIIKDQERKNRN